MPAQWPLFVNNLSKKLASRDSKGPDDIGMFVADEYFKAVKTAQTPFGNLHKPGQKTILEEGFKKAFNMLFKSTEPQLEDKIGNPLYSDLLEKLPNTDLIANPDCDFEEWTLKNKDKIKPFEFYPLFPTTCIIPKPNVSGGIDIKNAEDQPDLRYVTLSVSGGGGTSPYEFTYSLNGEIQPVLTSDSAGIVKFLAPTNPGKYKYTFISAIDSSKKEKIKNINRSASIEIKEDAKVEIKASTLKPYQLVKPMTEDQKVNELTNRVIYQNDGTEEYLGWVERLSAYGDLAKKVNQKALQLLNTEAKSMNMDLTVQLLRTVKNKNKIKKQEVTNDRLFQEEHDDRPDNIPKWLTADLICIFTYVKGIDDTSRIASKSLTKYNYKKSILDKKLVKYNDEKVKYRNLKVDYINQIAKNNKNTGKPCGADDAYCVMSKCIIDYWKSTAAQPFAKTPPILPCLLPQPGNYIPVFYGDESKLGGDLRKAWNIGKQFKLEPTIQNATKAVATAVAASCAKHLLELKFIYNGQIPTPNGPVPMIGFSPLAL